MLKLSLPGLQVLCLYHHSIFKSLSSLPVSASSNFQRGFLLLLQQCRQPIKLLQTPTGTCPSVRSRGMRARLSGVAAQKTTQRGGLQLARVHCLTAVLFGNMGRGLSCLSLLGACVLALAVTPAQGLFFEDFGPGWNSRWIHSTESKYNGKFSVETPEGLETPGLKVRPWIIGSCLPATSGLHNHTRAPFTTLDPCRGSAVKELIGSRSFAAHANERYARPARRAGGLMQVTEKARHYGIVAQLDKPVKAEKGLALQFELKLADGLTCGGAYLKYLTSGEFEASGLKDDTPYTVMFGPDKCGATNKVCLTRLRQFLL